MVTDARPFCRRCRVPPPVELGGGASWSRAPLPKGSNMYVGMADAVAFFFRLGIDGALGRYFCLPEVPQSLLESLGLKFNSSSSRPWYPYFTLRSKCTWRC